MPPKRGRARRVGRARCVGRAKTGWRIATLVMLFLAVLEVVVRVWLVPASKNLANIVTYETRAERLAGGDGLKLAVVGNSSALLGVDSEMLASRLAQLGRPGVRAEEFTPDSSYVTDWYCLLDRYFWNRGASPDMAVLFFFDDQLRDGNPVQTGRLAYYLAALDDVPVLFAHQFTSVGQRIEFLISSVWVSYAERARLQQNVFRRILPDYENYLTALNDTQFRQDQRKAAASLPPSFFLLQQLIRRARQHHTRLVFVAFPRLPGEADLSAERCNLDQEAVRLIQGEGMEFLDLRRVEGLSADMYRDSIHMMETGARVFTQVLTEHLAQLLPPAHGRGAAADPPDPPAIQ